MAELREYLDASFEKQVINENAANGMPKTYRLRGIFQKGDTPNGNRRVYPTRLLSREINKLQESLQKRRIIGELDHPVGRDKPLTSLASHVITKLEIRGNEVWGELEVIPGTDAGRNLLGLIEANIGLGISSRGTGGLKPISGNLMEVDETFCLNTFDIVHEPSVAEAYLHEALEINKTFQKYDSYTGKKTVLYYIDRAFE